MNWLAEFLEWHRSRFDPFDWPAPDSDEYVEYMIDWQKAFEGEDVSEDEARRASRRLSLAPPKYRREHLPALLAVLAAMRSARVSPTGEPLSRDAAKAASYRCEWCSGEGQLTLWHPDPSTRLRIPPTVGAHCVCQHGRFIRSKIAQSKDGEYLLKRIPDFAFVLSGGTGWLTSEQFHGVEAWSPPSRASSAGPREGT